MAVGFTQPVPQKTLNTTGDEGTLGELLLLCESKLFFGYLPMLLYNDILYNC